MSRLSQKPCPVCGEPIDDFTWLAHQVYHQHQGDLILPVMGKLVRDFGVKLLEWRAAKILAHPCLAAANWKECNHKTPQECWAQLVADCARDLREGKL